MRTAAEGQHTHRRRDAGRQGPERHLCSRCNERKNTLHRNRQTRKLVCNSCADRARLQVGHCAECRQRKLLQARGCCYACYKRAWRAARTVGSHSRSTFRQAG